MIIKDKKSNNIVLGNLINLNLKYQKQEENYYLLNEINDIRISEKHI